MENVLQKLQGCEHRLSVHGQAVRIRCESPAMNWPVHHALGEFATPTWPDGFQPLPGSIQMYEESVVLRHLSPKAIPIATGDDLIELYEDGERFWLVDDRWGLCQVNLLKNEWTSWVLPQPRLSGVELTDAAVLWPLAQLLQKTGLTLIPAVSMARGGFGVLIITPFGIEPELSALIEAGWRLIGQRWTALRMENDRVSMLKMPGAVHRQNGRIPAGAGANTSNIVDLSAEKPEATAFHAFCDAVVLVDAARRAGVSLQPLKGSNVVHMMRKCWPIFELRAQPRGQSVQAALASHCGVFEARLSRRADEFVMAMDRVAAGRAPRPSRLLPRLFPVGRPQQAPAA